jgi:flagellar hook-length control protein FliK
VRQPGANSAGSFRDLLAAFDPAESSLIGSKEAPPAGSAEESAEDTATSDQSAEETSDETAGEIAEAGQPGGPSAGPTADPDANIGQAAAYELADAASVDLARLAREQLRADPATAEAGRTPEPIPDPKQPAKHEMVSAHGSKGVPPPDSQPKLTDSADPPPTGDAGRTPPTVTAASTDRGGVPDASARSTGHEASSAAVDARRAAQPATASQAGLVAAQAQAQAQANRPNAKADTAAAAINRANLIERLTASAETGRGAVAAPDRVGQQPLGREAERSASNTPSPDAARQTREAVLNTVQRGLASVLSQGGGRMTVVLRPERLGEVRVRMDTTDGVVNARLSATTDAARRTLESGLDSLRAALEARGVRVESLQIDPAPQQADARPSGPNAGENGGTDPDGQRHHTDQHHTDRNIAALDRSERPDRLELGAGEIDPPWSRAGIWTELGLDAIA